MDNKKLANEIIKNVGGIGNINSVQHCTTRLRFRLKDHTLIKTKIIEGLNEVIGVVDKGGQLQVVIGARVKDVYNEVINIVGDTEEAEASSNPNASVVDKLLDTISGIFVPIIPALTGTGMLQAVLSILIFFKIVDNTSQTYQVLNAFANAAFHFLPILLACSAAKKFKCNQYVAMTIAAALLHPSFTGLVSTAIREGTSASFFGLPVSLVSYASTVFPILLTVWIGAYIEKLANKVMPKALQLIMVPMVTILIMIPIVLVVVGPLGNNIGMYLADFLTWLYGVVPWFVPMLIGAIAPFVIMTGMHFAGLIPIAVSLLATTGIDNVIGPGMLVSNFAIGGAVLAIALKSKQLSTKQVAYSSSLSSVCGIAEPALYGICVRFKSAMIATVIGGAAGGLFCGITGVGRFAQAGNSVFSLASYIGGDSLTTFYLAIVGCAIGFAVAFIFSFFLGIKEDCKDVKIVKKLTVESEVIYAPIQGDLIRLSEVNDSTFAQKMMGEGIAIKPNDGKVYAPVNGTISMVFNKSNHAVGIVSNKGSEILIHVGLDTVELEGKFYTSHVKEGDSIKTGDLLLEFDIANIEKLGYDTTTPIIITNTSAYEKVSCSEHKFVSMNDVVMKLDRT